MSTGPDGGRDDTNAGRGATTALTVDPETAFAELKSAYQSSGVGLLEDSDGSSTTSDTPTTATDAPSTATADAGPSKPYLDALPDGYDDEFLVLEWLDLLVRASSTPTVLRALRYYERLDWITAGVAAELRTYLGSLGKRDPASTGTSAADDGDGRGGLSVDHHLRSLEFIARLAGDDVGAGRVNSPDRGPRRPDQGTRRVAWADRRADRDARRSDLGSRRSDYSDRGIDKPVRQGVDQAVR